MSTAKYAFKAAAYFIKRRRKKEDAKAEFIGDANEKWLVVEAADGRTYCFGDGLGIPEMTPYYVAVAGHRFYFPRHVHEVSVAEMDRED